MDTGTERSSEMKCLNGSYFDSESIKIMAETIGIKSLPDDAARTLGENVSEKVKFILRDALKFMHHSKRNCMTMDDIQRALKVQNIEPLYGFLNVQNTPFRFAAGGGRELHFLEEKEYNLKSIIEQTKPKVPLDVTLRTHWIAVNGIQPAVLENPAPIYSIQKNVQIANPCVKIEQKAPRSTLTYPINVKPAKLRNTERVYVKQLATHELPAEKQMYYKAITEACVCVNESRRSEALESLATDPGLYELMPRICSFIAEGVKVNLVESNLAMLIYLMRMVKALMDNSTLFIEKYLHDLLPAVITCIVSKQLSTQDKVNHWALRDYAARLMSRICGSYSTPTNNLQSRVIRIFNQALFNRRGFLVSIYGAVVGLAALGVEAVKAYLLPRLKLISQRIELQILSCTQDAFDKVTAEHIRTQLQKHCVPLILQLRNTPDSMDDYRQAYGTFLGSALCLGVLKARGTVANTATALKGNQQLKCVFGTPHHGYRGLAVNSQLTRAPIVENLTIAVDDKQQK